MHNPEAILEQARQALAQKHFPHAEQLAARALELLPSMPAAWLALAQARRGQGRTEDALAACNHLLRQAPGAAEARLLLAELLLDAGRAGEAFSQVQPWAARQGGGALGQAGLLFAQRNHLPEGIELMRQAVEANPGDARGRNNLGVALTLAGRPAEAAEQLAEAARLEPDYAEAWFNLGNALNELGQRDEAEDAFRRALQAQPDRWGTLINLGLLLQETRRPAEAAVLLRQAARLNPIAVEAHNNLGLALADLGRFDQAEACYHEALRLRPDYADAHVNLGCAQKELGRTEEALACFGLALCLDPTSRSARYNRALTLLQAGRWQEGWRDYEFRWGRKSQPERPFDRPRWDGAEVAGKTVLVWCEQGLGDAVQFLRFAPLLKAKAARVVVECPKSLLNLFATCEGIDGLAGEGEPLPDFDVQVPLMSLPGLLTQSADDVPNQPYLSAEPGRVVRWRQALGEPAGLRVGIVWQGNPRFEWDRWRSAPLEAFAPLAGVEGVELVSLQKGPGEEQIDALRGRFAVRRLEGLDGESGAFLDTAAVLSCLDLLVCVDTSVGHLAGALGVPVWLALSTVSDWRWQRDKEDTFWYSRHRLFSQEKLGDWSSVSGRMACELERLVMGRRRTGSVMVETAPAELLDRLCIARIKAERIKDEAKLAHVRRELAALERAGQRLNWLAEVEDLLAQLKAVNEELWDVEDELRLYEARKDFKQRFVELARSVYTLNDRRGALKRRINEQLGAAWTEQKQYGRG